MNDFDDALSTVHDAGSPADLFGPPGGALDTRAKHRYRQLASRLHPDRAPAHRTTEATEGFARLSELWRRRHRVPEFTVGGVTYRLGDKLAEGDLANLYLLNESEQTVVLKLARNPADNDLIQAETGALQRLAGAEPRFAAYVPRLLGTVRHRDPDTGAERQGNVIDRLTGFRPLTDVIDAYPAGIDPRDAAWMFRRLLVGLGHAHRCGLVHGAVLPEHVLIHPEQHGLVIVDWCYQPGPGGRIAAMVSRYTDWYPPEVADRHPADASTDIYLAARCLDYLIKEHASQRMRDFIRGCLLDSQAARPPDAWQLLSEFDDLLHQAYGPRRFRPFELPDTR